MYNFLQSLHSGWAYLVLFFGAALLVLAILNKIGVFSNFAALKKISFFTTLSFHIQFLVGIILYFVSPFGLKNIQTLGMKGVTENDDLRLLALEHPLMMFAAVLFITIANAKVKRSAGVLSLPPVLFIAIAMACVLAMIPWQNWLG